MTSLKYQAINDMIAAIGLSADPALLAGEITSSCNILYDISFIL
ncbi:MAG TPA: hypothetical protein VJ280_02485 [Dehalococcoidales bacterium]|nr:hypothetical protein [Dehalococcoidales bacterium]